MSPVPQDPRCSAHLQLQREAWVPQWPPTRSGVQGPAAAAAAGGAGRVGEVVRAPHHGKLPPPGAAGRGAPSAGHPPLPPKEWQKGGHGLGDAGHSASPLTPGLAAAMGSPAKTRAGGVGSHSRAGSAGASPARDWGRETGDKGLGTSARARQDPWQVVGWRHGQSIRMGAAGHGQGPLSQGCHGQGSWGTHLVQVDGVEAHLGRGHLGEQRRAAQAAQPRLTQEQAVGRAGEHRAGTRGPATAPPPHHDTPSPHRLHCPPSLPAPVQGSAEPPGHPQTPHRQDLSSVSGRSLWQPGLSAEVPRVRPGSGDAREARTLAAALAVLQGWAKRRSQDTSPLAERMGRARTLASKPSGCGDTGQGSPSRRPPWTPSPPPVPLTATAESSERREAPSGPSARMRWAGGAAAASCCTFSFSWLRKSSLGGGGCQRGLVMAKCISDSSVFPFSACWYTEASVCPADSHCGTGG